MRRACFAETMKCYGGNKIALAHHMNDNAETLLMNLARGTGLRGLGGMKPVQGVYIRPLLCVTREEIEEYLEKEGISFCEDVTNGTDLYTRNRIRNHVIPYLQQEVNSAALLHMGETMEQLRVVEEYLDLQAAEAFSKAVQMQEESYLVRGESWEKLHEALRPLVIKKVLKNIAASEKDIEQCHLQAVMDLFAKQAGRQVDLPYEMNAKRVYEGVRIQKKEEAVSEEFEHSISLQTGNHGTIFYDDMKLEYRIIEKSKEKFGL